MNDGIKKINKSDKEAYLNFTETKDATVSFTSLLKLIKFDCIFNTPWLLQ